MQAERDHTHSFNCSAATTSEQPGSTVDAQHKHHEGEDKPLLPGSRSGAGRSLGLLGFLGIIFVNTCGGPQGTEGLVRFGGPLPALLGLLVAPWIFSYPTALFTSEMSTRFPHDSGYSGWVKRGFGQAAGFLTGWAAWSSGTLDNALYPAMIFSIIQAVSGKTASSLFLFLGKMGFILLFTCVSLLDIKGVGTFSEYAATVTMVPFVIFCLVLIPFGHFKNWITWRSATLGSTSDGSALSFINILFWNYNGFDSPANISGRVVNPVTTIPKALILLVPLVTASYVLPLLAATGTDTPFSSYHNGTFGVIAMKSHWALGTIVTVSMVVSTCGMFVASLTADSYLAAGMADEGLVPEWFRSRNARGTPVRAIVTRALIITVCSLLDFKQLLEGQAMLHGLRMIMELAAFVYLRAPSRFGSDIWSLPSSAAVDCVRDDIGNSDNSGAESQQHFTVPGGSAGFVLTVLGPLAVVILQLAMAPLHAWIGGLLLLGVGCLLYAVEHAGLVGHLRSA